MHMDYEYIIFPYDDLTHDVVLISCNKRDAVTTRSIILAVEWLNLFDADYHLEFKNYGIFERLFIYTDIRYEILKCITTFLHERKLVYNNIEELVEVIEISERFDLTQLIKSILKNIHTASLNNKSYLFWGWRIGNKYGDQNKNMLWREILYYTPINYTTDKNVTAGFVNLSFPELISFLKDQRLNVPNERKVLEMALFWFKNNEKIYGINYNYFLNEIFTCFRIRLDMEHEFAEELIKDYYPDMTLSMFPLLELSKCRYPRDVMIQLGGVREKGALNRIQIFDTRTGNWVYTRGINLPQTVANFSSETIGSKIYISGGSKNDVISNELFELNTTTFTWNRKSGMNYPRCFHRLLAYKGKLYALGGKAEIRATDRLTTFERYDPATNVWTILKPMPVARSDFGALIINDCLVASGGYSGSEILSSSHIYNFKTDEWREGPILTIPRKGHALIQIDTNKIVAIGGAWHETRLNSCECAIIDQYYFEEFPSLLKNRSNFGAISYNEKIYVCGGYTSNGFTNECEIFDGKEWKYTHPLTDSLSSNHLVVVRNMKCVKMFLDCPSVNLKNFQSGRHYN
ncbi:Kelch repeat type 1 and BTB/Kelch-associated domain and Galactose oxidase, beta-propeller domain-containing protein [Strongyloides ratti]|uniref:Kelch repeat type 1 and BTB/Kelch-associated domain and Galactose oxidase, beta-propeller domain-containing protein n=1 Tax=Strongyloides ratti TaxID=34506 RepID=A0A090L5D5_STRRB|nr:Kelch repeat type 1 and BTB/Kelch-associated domain and Galactose oxidase, beta-propeller domain-containing protein [Strongyloides ratti]CEF65016.1 Kelch repeat type 1 and BTB/Kelch-associated domain and Galactose oxidase, beta-propeller domain-containing protein [Strongyloides ratti]